jgi:hypothetical protein
VLTPPCANGQMKAVSSSGKTFPKSTHPEMTATGTKATNSINKVLGVTANRRQRTSHFSAGTSSTHRSSQFREGLCIGKHTNWLQKSSELRRTSKQSPPIRSPSCVAPWPTETETEGLDRVQNKAVLAFGAVDEAVAPAEEALGMRTN